MAFKLPVTINEQASEFESAATLKVKSLASTKVGDLIVCSVHVLGTGVVKTSTGWTQRGTTQTKGGHSFFWFTRTATLAGAQEYPIVLEASKSVLWWTTRVEGVSSVLAASSSGTEGTSTIKWATATPTNKPTMDLILGANEGVTWTTPAGFTLAVSGEGTPIVAGFWRELTTEAATGETSGTISAAEPTGTLRLILLGEEVVAPTAHLLSLSGVGA